MVRSILLLALLGGAGCAGTVTTAGGRELGMASSAFRDYVERVFREQNRVATELAFALEDGGAGGVTLLELEQALLEDCAGLNRLAAARRDARRLPRLQARALARQAPLCEATTERVRRALAARQ